MTVESDEVVQFHHRPERRAIVQVGFEPSDKLRDTVRSFLIERVVGREVVFRSLDNIELNYFKSNNEGVVYEPDDQTNLDQERKRLKQMTNGLAIIGAEVKLSKRNDLQVTVEVQPTIMQRQLLGRYVLNELTTQGQPTFTAYTRFHHSIVNPEMEVIGERAAVLMDAFHQYEDQPRPVTVTPSTYYLKKPYVTEHLAGDLRVVK